MTDAATAIAPPAAAPPPREPREISTDTRPLNYFGDQRSFEIGQRQAVMLASSSIVPDLYRRYTLKNDQWIENPDAVGNCFIALELASRLHVSPLMVMQQVDMIRGRPSLRGTFLIGLINGSGEFTKLKWENNGKAGDEYGVRVIATRHEDGEECVGTWITWAMVKAEGWFSKSDSKWKTMPDQMFLYRSASFWSRAFAPHITLGLLEADEAREAFGDDEPQLRLGSTPARGAPVHRIEGSGGGSGLGALEAELAAQSSKADKPIDPTAGNNVVATAFDDDGQKVTIDLTQTRVVDTPTETTGARRGGVRRSGPPKATPAAVETVTADPTPVSIAVPANAQPDPVVAGLFNVE